MKSRMKIKTVEPRVYLAMDEAEKQMESFELDPKLMELVKLRTSQLNGCGYCVDYHAKNARMLGETEQRLYALGVWWETPFFTPEEQIAFELAEQITHIAEGGLSDDVYEKALQVFGPEKLAQLIFVIVAINSWNRIAIATHMVADKD